MNSVMDDNRLLTLPNGERIRLQDHCNTDCRTSSEKQTSKSYGGEAPHALGGDRKCARSARWAVWRPRAARGGHTECGGGQPSDGPAKPFFGRVQRSGAAR